jgi:Arc/MetJ family transcription regulator
MRTTLTLDDELLAKAQALTGISEKSSLVREALRALIQRESANQLALLGGSEPQLSDIPRRQSSGLADDVGVGERFCASHHRI